MAVVLPIVTEYSGRGLEAAIREVKKAEGSFGKLSAAGGVLKASLAGAAVGFAALGAAAVVRGLQESVKAASDLTEAANKSAVIFGEASAEVAKFANTSSITLGQSKTQAIDAASAFAVFGKAAGLAGAELTTFSTQLTTLASDLASFYNTSPADAIRAITAGLQGEVEPLRRYGVLLNEASLKAEYFAKTGREVTGVLTPQQRVLAAQSLILKQTTDAQGDFARTQNGLANTTRTLTAAVENAKASLGEGYLKAINAATAAIGGPQGLAFQIEAAALRAKELMGYLGPLAKLFGQNGDAARNYAYDLNYSYDSLKLLAKTTGFYQLALTPLLNLIEDNTKAAYNLGDGYFYAANGMKTFVGAAGYSASMISDLKGAQNKALGYTPNPYRDYNDYDQTRIDNIAKIIEAQKKAQSEAEKLQKAAGGAAKEVDSKRYDSAMRKLEGLKQQYEDLKTKAEEAAQRLRDYAQAKSDWITSVSIGDAISAQLEDAAKRFDLDKRIAEAIAKGDSEGAAKLAAEKAGMGAAVSWVDGFLEQIRSRKDAAQAIDELMKTLNPADTLGNQRLLDQLTTLTPEQAKLAAEDLIKRGLGPTIAAELSSLDVWANGTAETWAQTFYGPGQAAADQAVQGLTTQLQAAAKQLYREGKKLGGKFMEGFRDATAGLPGGVSVQAPSVSSGLTAAAAPITVNVTAGVGNPIAIAREVEAVLNAAGVRLGVR